jgi:hypothetical protein
LSSYDYLKCLLSGDTHQKTCTQKISLNDVHNLASCLHDAGNKLGFLLIDLRRTILNDKRLKRCLHAKFLYHFYFVFHHLLVFKFTSTFNFYNEVLGALLQNERDNEWHLSKKFGNQSQSGFLHSFIFHYWDTNLFSIRLD